MDVHSDKGYTDTIYTLKDHNLCRSSSYLNLLFIIIFLICTATVVLDGLFWVIKFQPDKTVPSRA